MAIFLDPRGQPTYGQGICGRCSRKLPLAMLKPDRNAPGLMVCDKDNDVLDPYRLPPRAPDKLNLPFVRPDISLAGLPPSYAEYAVVGVIGDSAENIYMTGDDGTGQQVSILAWGLP